MEIDFWLSGFLVYSTGKKQWGGGFLFMKSSIFNGEMLQFDYTPEVYHMEHNHEGLVQMIFLRFQPLGVILFNWMIEAPTSPWITILWLVNLPRNVTPLRNKDFMAGLIKGNQWLISLY